VIDGPVVSGIVEDEVFVLLFEGVSIRRSFQMRAIVAEGRLMRINSWRAAARSNQ